jgi:hypothetical protein
VVRPDGCNGRRGVDLPEHIEEEVFSLGLGTKGIHHGHSGYQAALKFFLSSYLAALDHGKPG